MDTIKKMLLIFVVNTLVMLVAWAALSVALFAVKAWIGSQAPLATVLSINSYVIVMFFYAFYLIFDLSEYLSTQTLKRNESSNPA